MVGVQGREGDSVALLEHCQGGYCRHTKSSPVGTLTSEVRMRADEGRVYHRREAALMRRHGVPRVAVKQAATSSRWHTETAPARRASSGNKYHIAHSRFLRTASCRRVSETEQIGYGKEE
jgi:hypothetical protein